MVLMRALYDVVLIETVGVGQSETDVAAAADTVVFCVQPGSGDSLQFMKAGILEIPHIVVVTKADMGAAASRALTDVAGVIGAAGDESGWRVPVLALSALNREGVTARSRRWTPVPPSSPPGAGSPVGATPRPRTGWPTPCANASAARA